MKDLLVIKQNGRYWSKNNPRGDFLCMWQLDDGTVVGFVADAPAEAPPETSALLKDGVREACEVAVSSNERWQAATLVRHVINCATLNLARFNEERPGMPLAEACGCTFVIRHGQIAVGGMGDCSVVLIGASRSIRLTDSSGEQPMPLVDHKLVPFGFHPSSRLGHYAEIYVSQKGALQPVRYKAGDFYRVVFFTDGLDCHSPNFEEIVASGTTQEVVNELSASVPGSREAGLMDDVSFAVLSFQDLDDAARQHLMRPPPVGSPIAEPEPEPEVSPSIGRGLLKQISRLKAGAVDAVKSITQAAPPTQAPSEGGPDAGDSGASLPPDEIGRLTIQVGRLRIANFVLTLLVVLCLAVCAWIYWHTATRLPSWLARPTGGQPANTREPGGQRWIQGDAPAQSSAAEIAGRSAEIALEAAKAAKEAAEAASAATGTAQKAAEVAEASSAAAKDALTVAQTSSTQAQKAAEEAQKNTEAIKKVAEEAKKTAEEAKKAAADAAAKSVSSAKNKK